MTVVYHIASPAPEPPTLAEPREEKFLKHHDIFSPQLVGTETEHAERAHQPEPFTSIFEKQEIPQRKIYCQNARNQSNPFGSEADFPKANRNLKEEITTDPFRSDRDATEVKPRESRIHRESYEDLNMVRHQAPPRDLLRRAGISSEREYHVPIKGKVQQPKQGDEVFETVRGKKHVEPVFDDFEKTFKINQQYQKSNLYAANDIPKSCECRSPPTTCFNFTKEQERKVQPSDAHTRTTDVEVFRHTEPITKRDCTQPNEVDLRSLKFDEVAIEQQREQNYEMMMENKRRWAGW